MFVLKQITRNIKNCINICLLEIFGILMLNNLAITYPCATLFMLIKYNLKEMLLSLES